MVTEATRRRWWVGLRVLVLGLWLIAAAASWWTAPRPSSYERARADIAAGHVVAYQWGDRWDDLDSRWWFTASTLQSSGTIGPLFGWRTGDGRVHWIDSGNFEQVTVTGTVDETSYAGRGAAGLGEELLAAGLERRSGDLHPFGGLVTVAGTVLVLVFLATLLAGPAPVRGTRWFWFWLGCVTPYGLGVLFWIFRDCPWVAVALPSGPPRRDRGIVGLAIGLLASLIVGLLLAALHAVLGDWWVP